MEGNTTELNEVIEAHIRTWHVAQDDLESLHWNDETISMEQILWGNPSEQMFRIIRNQQLAQHEPNSSDYINILRYFNIIMEKLIETEE